ncbi:alpha/beta hydrolase [Sphingomonas sp. PAMC 26605]|uniref:alpha/beta hydrolase n=1 Tax=Sphingomonas sp. PAMC 26605 TaxID=1112214 RepID=UPI00026CB114|nr:alpha/beta hydrolase [Sphingomonas sp. PAMC 26605]
MTPALRPDVRAFLDLVSASPLARLGDYGIEEARAISNQMRSPPPDPGSVRVSDTSFTHPGGDIALRCYDPGTSHTSTPLMVYFHGGGFVMGDLDSHHQLCLTLAAGVGLPLVSVAYRLAPENPWPAAPDDAAAAARWLAVHGAELFDTETTGLVLAGDSAGANLAAVTARALADTPAACPVLAQCLLYPCVSLDPTTRSMRENGEGLFLTRTALDWFTAHYRAPSDSPRYNLLAFDQAGMPPTLLVTAEFDPLRDEGRAYAARLAEAGVSVTYQEVRGHIHGCFGFAPAIRSTKRDVDRAIAALGVLLS